MSHLFRRLFEWKWSGGITFWQTVAGVMVVCSCHGDRLARFVATVGKKKQRNEPTYQPYLATCVMAREAADVVPSG